jgi:MazG family protein
MKLDEAAAAFRELASIVKALRTPGTGCPWDLEQDHRTLRPYLVEETYEVLDAIDRGDDPALREELGDLLLQVMLHAQLADDRGAFSINDVVRGIAAKMVRRHPHVFGTTAVSGSEEVVHNWERIKAAEQRAGGGPARDELDRVPPGLPALRQAQQLGAKVGRALGGRGPLAGGLDAVRRDLDGLAGQIPPAGGAAGAPAGQRQRLERAVGDLLLSLCLLAERLGVSAEDGLRESNRRFAEQSRRLRQQSSRAVAELSDDELGAAWDRAGEP